MLVQQQVAIGLYALSEIVCSCTFIENAPMQRDWRDSALPQPVVPEALVHVSATVGSGVVELTEALQRLLQ